MSKPDFYDRIYKKNPHKWEMADYDRMAFETLSGYFGEYRPRSLLDIGCGNGHTLEYFIKRWPEVYYTGLDISKQAIELAKHRVPQAYYHCGALEDIIFPRKYDCITLLGVIEHFDDLAKSLGKLREMLAEGGICYIEAPNCIDYPQSLHEEGYRKTNTGSHQVEWHLFRSTWDSILINAGFEITRSLKGPSMQSEFVWLVR
jgi:SAM-dependent methyltransferase